MEILMLVLLYYLSQNENFAESVKPIMSQIKDSEAMLCFLNDLSKFTQTFSSFQSEPKPHQRPPKEEQAKKEKETQKTSASPTEGIADAFIQNILEHYLKQN